MTELQTSTYAPDYLVTPGAVLADYLDGLDMSQKELAERTGLTTKTISGIVTGKEPISTETAFRFERALGRPAHFWSNLEQRYQEDKLRTQREQELQAWLEWPKRFPFADMAKRGWLPAARDNVKRAELLLRFFGIASPDRWDAMWADYAVAYRKTARFEASDYALSAWLRRGELLARNMACAPFSASHFRQVLHQIRGLTQEEPGVFEPRLAALCASAGVAVVLVPQLPGSRASGCTRWLGDKAVIQLSLRYRTNDHFWFTFFHEAGHVLRHGKKAIFLEGHGLCDERENEANRFAADFLIPPEELRAFVQAGDFSQNAVLRFAQHIGIAPGIVIGRLQFDKHLPFQTRLNHLKVSFCWTADEQPG